MGTLLPKIWEKNMAKIYIVDLSAEEKEQLLELTSRGQAPARKMKRAQILLLANEGKKDETIAEVLHRDMPARCLEERPANGQPQARQFVAGHSSHWH